MNLRQQLSAAITAALHARNMTQADLARQMGLSPKHVNHLVNGKAGSIGIYDFAAFTLGLEWDVGLRAEDTDTCPTCDGEGTVEYDQAEGTPFGGGMYVIDLPCSDPWHGDGTGR